jgi:hypothetical protein
MSELNQGTLRALTFARDQVRSHPAIALSIAGFAASTLIVLAGGQVGTVKSVIPITDWMGMLSVQGRRRGDYGPGSLMLLGIAALIGIWIIALRLRHAATITERRVWWIAGAWAVPFVVGPPVISNDVWTYSAQGLMMRNGLDPYSVGPSSLGNIPIVAAVDPSWRSVPSPYGPLAATAQHLAIAISGGNPIGAVIVFRALAVACFIAIGVLAADLAGNRRIQALMLTVLNPLLLMHLVSGAHLEGLMCVLLLAALLAAHQRRWLLAIVLACAAGSVKAPAFVAVLAIIAVHHQHFRGWLAWRISARDAAVAAVSVVGFSAIVRNGWGWVHALSTPSLGHTSLAPASLVADMFDPVVRAASFDDLATGGRITTMLAAVCAVIYLTVTARRRALAQTIGYGLIAVGLLGPVLYPWYMLWGVVCLAPTARAERRDLVVLVSASACLFDPPGFTRFITDNLSLTALAIAFAWFGGRALVRSRAVAAPLATPEPSPPAEPEPSTTPAVEAGPAPLTALPVATLPASPQVSVGG